LVLLVVAATAPLLVTGCGKVDAKTAPRTILVDIFSGRPQPPAPVHSAVAHEPVLVRVRGLGPPLLAVEGPLPSGASGCPTPCTGSRRYLPLASPDRPPSDTLMLPDPTPGLYAINHILSGDPAAEHTALTVALLDVK